MRLSIIILAGGSARRFNANKLLAKLPDGQPMLTRVLEQCKPLCDNITVVTGAYHDAIARCMGPDVDIVFNELWQEGIAGSIRVGVEHIKATQTSTSHILVMLADLPLVSAQSLSVLVEVAALKPNMMIASYWDNRCTAPAVFPRQYWNQLVNLRGDSGAGKLLSQGMYTQPVHTYAVPHPEAAYDIDTVSALKSIKL